MKRGLVVNSVHDSTDGRPEREIPGVASCAFQATRRAVMKEPVGSSDSDRTLLDLELEKIFGTSPPPPDADKWLWGLALSGGGIRSATFSLGFLQALAKTGWLGAFHYLSTVSGGGYIGAFLQGMLKRHGLQSTLKVLDPERSSSGKSDQLKRALTGLRAYSNFLTPNKARFSADRLTLAAAYIGNTMLTQIQLVCWLMVAMLVPYGMLLVVEVGAQLPWLAILVAVIATFSAMFLRGRLQAEYEKNSPPTQERPEEPETLAPRQHEQGSAAQKKRVPRAIMTEGPPALLAGSALLTSAALFAGNMGEWWRFAAAAAVFVSGLAPWIYWWATRELRRPPPRDHAGREISFSVRLSIHLIAGLVAAILLGWAAALVSPLGFKSDFKDAYSWWSTIIGAPLTLLGFFAAAMLYVGVTMGSERDRISRERWARLMGRAATWIFVGVMAPCALVLAGPQLLKESMSQGEWIVPLLLLLAGALGVRLTYFAPEKVGGSKRTVDRALFSLAPGAVAIGILLLVASFMDRLLALPSRIPVELGILILAGIAYGLREFVDDNEFSMNGFYRNRLVRCYLAPSRGDDRSGDSEMGLDLADDEMICEFARIKEDELVPEHRPLYPLIAAAANLSCSGKLDWQDRRAASFVFSPIYCGHIPVSSDHTDAMGDIEPKEGKFAPKLAEETTLGTAASISGAAISPQMGYHTSAPMAFLLTLFNARVGWWVQNYNAPRRKRNSLEGIFGSKLIDEMLARGCDKAQYTYVSDGGHFENLGIYELVRRRCRFILSVDVTADPDRDFESLGNAIHKCRVDFGVNIDIDVSLIRPDEHGISRRRATLGKIHYPDKTEGLIVYVKPCLLGDESADITHYAAAHREFPHEPTSDQFFDEQQFEAYRELGFVTGRTLLDHASRTADLRTIRAEHQLPDRTPMCPDDPRKEGLLLELEHWLYEPSETTALQHSEHGARLTRLLERQRRSPELECLDPQLYRGWLHANGPDTKRPRPMGLPLRKDFRACFYFVQEMIQLMEAVYLDLDLERNAMHPDNRGWINQFRQWSWVPIFRLVWALTAQSRGSRFAHFCEERLGVPRVTSALCVAWSDPVPDMSAYADLLHQNHEITFIERDLLKSEAIARQAKAHSLRVGLLRIDWSRIFGTLEIDRSNLHRLNLGLLVASSVVPSSPVSSEDVRMRTLIVGRIQDHVRRMGLGAEMVYQGLGHEDMGGIEFVQILPGHYGPTIGPLNAATIDTQQAELEDMLRRARARHGFQPGGLDSIGFPRAAHGREAEQFIRRLTH